MKSVAAAVVGCGRMGAFTSEAVRRFAPACWLPLSHAEAIAGHPRIRLVALCDSNAEAAARACTAYAPAREFADFRQMIAAVSPELLGIATRTPDRFEVLGYAVAHGVRALHIEKPLCNSVEQLLELERVLASEQVACTYGTLRRYFGVYRRARELAWSGRIGKVEHVTAGFGAATLFWTHPHTVDLLCFMANDAAVASVSARFEERSVERSGLRLDCDPRVLYTFVQFESGVTASVTPSGACDVTIFGTEGSVTVQSDGHEVRLRSREGSDPYWRSDGALNLADPGAPVEGTRAAIDRLVAALDGAEPGRIVADKRAIFQGQRILFAIAQSHLAGGAPVDPGQLDPALSITGRSGKRFA